MDWAHIGPVFGVSEETFLLGRLLNKLGNGPRMSRPHYANGQGLDSGLRFPPGWRIFGANL